MIYHILHDFRILYYVESIVFTNKFTELVDGFYFFYNFMINTLDSQIKYHMNVSSEISGKPRTSPLIFQNKSAKKRCEICQGECRQVCRRTHTSLPSRM